ncbi:hypothetical protein KX928_10445 [Roseobacter sp. YSTF-M11]|uniref:DUF1653 domain-containing protein n=1 Tax=Roseobacter insulae TaxID=2859783 RepID=A0A9X1FWJ2_9RHOB|nr:hypothetical protein [Roseobacter insulae]MBW4708203.1 hypothetical protein [Roseobacter insulae]
MMRVSVIHRLLAARRLWRVPFMAAGRRTRTMTGPGGLRAPDWAATHRHRKGGLYRVLARGILESDRSDVVIYDDPDGTVWVRCAREFEDGRFIPEKPASN